MITTSIASSLAAPTTLFGEVGQRCFKLSRPFLSHPSPRCPAGTHATKEPHPQPIQVSSRKESEPTKHLPETDRPASPGQETAADSVRGPRALSGGVQPRPDLMGSAGVVSGRLGAGSGRRDSTHRIGPSKVLRQTVRPSVVRRRDG